ncbi:hypothetical protein EC973_000379 [Apophysomyces ossiformis]|uniref:DDRGK domain-containing protein 1 n=1 Tax=Apophysomyces ossiformis TaxID=679940 RepID=A0A8H7ESP8_9FUNG|nr:hypothetical protein EC973_000379 [Apophysomyces ossiformis]
MASDIPFLLFVPLLVCLFGIAVLLEIRKRQNDPNYHQTSFYTEQPQYDDGRTVLSEDDLSEPDNDNNTEDAAEGSSSAVRVKPIGKKKAEKLRRKEQMRQYREYMNQQNEARRIQEEILEEEFKRKKAEDSIRREEEMEVRRRAQEKKRKQAEAERQEKEKAAAKEMKQKRALYNKYSAKVKSVVQEHLKDLRVCALDQVGYITGLADEVGK